MADKTVQKTRNAKSDLNRADRDELVSVPGIGSAAAESILKHRGDRGGFKSLDELSDITGIGAQTVQNLRERYHLRQACRRPRVGLKARGQSARNQPADYRGDRQAGR